KVHPKFKTPSFATIVTGFVVAVPALFLNLTMVTDLCSIGTLFAFVLVCLGVLVLQNKKDIPRGKFKTPYINSKYIMSALLVLTIILSLTYNKNATLSFITNQKKINDAKTIITSLNTQQIEAIKTGIAKTDSLAFSKSNNDVETYMNTLSEASYATLVQSLPIDESEKYESGWNLFKHKIPMWFFIIVCFALAVWAFKQNLSLIPLLGLICCLYMMAELGLSNWIGFSIWLVVGLVVYFSYGYRKSKLNLDLAKQ
ncbi:MAG TPA: amino acid permease C-terminal domain-containing protein, partial [Bacteroidia bacterium]